MAFNRNPLDSMSSSAQRFGIGDMHYWSASAQQSQSQFGMSNSSGRKSAPDLSPGRTNVSSMSGFPKIFPEDQLPGSQVMFPRPRSKDGVLKNYLYGGDDDDNEASMYFNTWHRQEKDPLTSPSPNQLSGFGSSLIGNMSQLQQRGLQQQFNRSTSVPGHITPTSISTAGLLSGIPAQQASPNRNMFAPVSRSSFSQAQVAPPMGSLHAQKSKSPAFQLLSSSSATSTSGMTPSMAAFGFSSSMSRAFSSQPSGIFSSTGNESGTAGLDLSEFPSLKAGGSSTGTPPIPTNPMTGRPAYVGMVKQPQSEQQQEFQIQAEDFPALPGSTQVSDHGRDNTDPTKSGQVSVGDKQGSQQSHKRGIQTSPDGTVSNLPSSMVQDQFGIVGLLTFIRVGETDPNLVSLALGSDLTTLGLNLNSPENLYPNFGGSWADQPCRPQDIDFHVPQEYLCNMILREKLAPIKLNRYGEDLLFYLFYTNCGDFLQLAAAAELYNREWRYHKEERVWISRAPGMIPVEKANTYERGTYYFFDAQSWRKVAKEFHLDYDKLEGRPHLPQSMHHNPNPLHTTLGQ